MIYLLFIIIHISATTNLYFVGDSVAFWDALAVEICKPSSLEDVGLVAVLQMLTVTKLMLLWCVCLFIDPLVWKACTVPILCPGVRKDAAIIIIMCPLWPLVCRAKRCLAGSQAV